MKNFVVIHQFYIFVDKVKVVKGPKPLIYHKFYLDIEKHNIATKIENKIKELGGVSMNMEFKFKELINEKKRIRCKNTT